MFSRSFLHAVVFVISLTLAWAATPSEEIISTLGHSDIDSPDTLFNTNEADFNILTNLILAANLGRFLDDDVENGFTLFAPNDKAFAQTAKDLDIGGASEKEIYENLFLFLSRQYENPVSALQRIVVYHILPRKFKFPSYPTTDIETSTFDTALELRGITRNGFTLIDRNPYQPDPRVIPGNTDLEFANVIVHVIDRMLFFEPLELRESPEFAAEDSLVEPSQTFSAYASGEYPSFPYSTQERVTNAPDDNIGLQSSYPVPTKTATPSTIPAYVETSAIQFSPEPFRTPESEVGESFIVPSYEETPTALEETAAVQTDEANTEPLPSLDVKAEETPFEYIDFEEIDSPRPEESLSPGSAPHVTTPPVATDDQFSTDTENYYPLTTTEVSISADDPEAFATEATPQPVYIPDATSEEAFASTPEASEPLPVPSIGADDPEASAIAMTLQPVYIPDATSEETLASTPEASEQLPVPSIDADDPEASAIAMTLQPVYIPDATSEETFASTPEASEPVPIPEAWPIETEEGDSEYWYIPLGTGEFEWDFASASPDFTIENGECFPASQMVHLENGSDISLSQLSAGHVIRASESESSMVYLFTHKKHTGVFDFVRIITDGNHEVVMTKGHYIYANGILKAAGSVNIGDTLRTLDGPARVRSIRTTHDYGLFAPHTLHGDIVVNRVITSTYTTALHPVIAHVILWPLRALVHLGVAKEPLGPILRDGVQGLLQRTRPVST